jgi:hypothetical protein
MEKRITKNGMSEQINEERNKLGAGNNKKDTKSAGHSLGKQNTVRQNAV